MPAYRIVALLEQTIVSKSFACQDNDHFFFSPDDHTSDAHAQPLAIPFAVVNGQLTITSTQNETFYLNNEEIHSAIVPDGSHLVVSVPSKDFLHLFVLNLHSPSMQKYSLHGINEVFIGNSSQCHLCYKSSIVSKKHIVLRPISPAQAELNDVSSNGYVYVQGKKTVHATLEVGDTVFVMGMTLCFCGDYIAVSAPAGLLSCSLSPYTQPDTSQVPQTDMPSSILFVRSPRIIKTPDTRELTIDPPPPCQTGQKLPLLYQLGPSMTMTMGMLINVGFSVGNVLSQGRGLSSFGGSIGMSVTMLAGALLWPTLNRRFHQKQLAENEQHRLQRYSSYIQNQMTVLRDYAEHNRAVHLDHLPSPDVLLERAEGLERRLWERMSSDDDFLDVRLGLGTVPSDVKIKIAEDHFSLTDDPLRFEARRVYDVFKNSSDMPIQLQLRSHNVVGVFGNQNSLFELVNSLVAQLTTQHSYDDVKLVFILPRAYEQQMSWVKLLPHTWSTDRRIRFVGITSEEIHEVFLYVDNQLKERMEEKDGSAKTNLPHYIFFIMDPDAVRSEPLMRLLTRTHNHLGLSSLFFSPSVKSLPSECSVVIQSSGADSCVYDRDGQRSELLAFVPDHFSTSDAVRLAEALCPIHVKTLSQLNESIPDSISFLDMYEAGRVEHLNILSRWQENRANKAILAPVGIRAGGEIFSLNLHELFHGPHGLVAGMTGSGKSEFLQTLILSLAINYHPNEVSFVLIDYKGGGMANAFDGMPHLSGKITDLGGNQIQRSLLSIRAEIHKRKCIFSDLRIQNINDYYKLYYDKKVTTPLPHLIIISDEFAELKSMQQEFMAELDSTARIGRTLGIHLILATQKPAGIVDDQIRSNSRFRVCLKVLDRQDSNEMLKRSEAATITLPGRCYIQIGYNEIFEYVQSAYSGSLYQPTEEYVDPETQTVMMIDNAAQPLRRAVNSPPADKDAPSQLKAIVSYLASLSKAGNISHYPLWLPPLSENLPLTSLPGFQNLINFDGINFGSCQQDHWMSIPVGLADDPSVQQQRMLTLNFARDGHILLYGSPTSGKTTFLQTVIYSLAMTHSPEDCLVDIFDFGGRSLGYCSTLPHCLESVFFAENEASIADALSMLIDELEKRKNLFALHDVGNILAYRQLGLSPLPAHLLIIDNYSGLREHYSSLESHIITLAREGANYGIYMLITASSVNAISYGVRDYIKCVLSLQLNEKSDYQSLFGRIEGILPESVKGRGLVRNQGRLIEYQTALAIAEPFDAPRVRYVREAFENMASCWKKQEPKWHRPHAAVSVPSLSATAASGVPFSRPAAVSVSSSASVANASSPSPAALMLPPIGTADNAQQRGLHIGTDRRGLPLYLPPEHFTTVSICSTNENELSTAFSIMLERAVELKDADLYVIDHPDTAHKAFAGAHNIHYASSAEETNAMIDALFAQMLDVRKPIHDDYITSGGNRENESVYMLEKQRRIVICIRDYLSLYGYLNPETLSKLITMVKNPVALHLSFICCSNPDALKTYKGSEPFWSLICKARYTIALAPVNDMLLVDFPNLSAADRTLSYSCVNALLCGSEGRPTRFSIV